MKFNLYWLSIKQLRMSQWLQEKIFLLGLAIHVWKKYHKINPSVIEILAHQQGGKLFNFQTKSLTRWGPNWYMETDMPVIDKNYALVAYETQRIDSRIKSLTLLGKDLIEGKLDYDQALFEEFASEFLIKAKQINKEVK